jgi:hypothetical protein
MQGFVRKTAMQHFAHWIPDLSHPDHSISNHGGEEQVLGWLRNWWVHPAFGIFQ